jgi:hypothetical protein
MKNRRRKTASINHDACCSNCIWSNAHRAYLDELFADSRFDFERLKEMFKAPPLELDDWFSGSDLSLEFLKSDK